MPEQTTPDPDVVWVRATAESPGVDDVTSWTAYHREEWDAMTEEQREEELADAGARALEELGASCGASVAEDVQLSELADEERRNALDALPPLPDPQPGHLIEFTNGRGRRQRLFAGHVERHRDAWLMWLGTSNQATRLTRDEFRIVGRS